MGYHEDQRVVIDGETYFKDSPGYRAYLESEVERLRDELSSAVHLKEVFKKRLGDRLVDIARLRDDNAAMMEQLNRWLSDRNSLSADCQKLGIGGSAADGAKWGLELARRCEPLRRFCENMFHRGVRPSEAAR